MYKKEAINKVKEYSILLNSTLTDLISKNFSVIKK